MKVCSAAGNEKCTLCFNLNLCFQNILKNFDKSDPNHAIVSEALDHMTGRAQHINEMKRKHEHAVRVQEIQSTLEDYEGEDLTRLGELVLEVREGRGFNEDVKYYKRLTDWLVVLRINVDLAIFQPYLDLEAGDNQSLKIQVARPGIEPLSSCSASQELNHSATPAPSLDLLKAINTGSY